MVPGRLARKREVREVPAVMAVQVQLEPRAVRAGMVALPDMARPAW